MITAASTLALSTSIRGLFPALDGNPSFTYLDSAATTQRPGALLAAEHEFQADGLANSGRSAHQWAARVADLISASREEVAKFLGSMNPEDLLFTSGATHSLNLVALCWGLPNLRTDDEILLCYADHHSMIGPWLRLKSFLKASRDIDIQLVPYRLRPRGEIDLDDIRSKISPRTRIVNVTHVNNAIGTINDLAALRDMLPHPVVLNVDIAQSFGHIELDLPRLGVDFASFSGHKAFSLTGIGGLWINSTVRSQIEPLFVGGGRDPFEPGTLNSTAIFSLAEAIRFIKSFGGVGYYSHLHQLTQTLYEEFLRSPQLELRYPAPLKDIDRKSAIASFSVPGVASAEIAEFLSEEGIFIRSGNFCTGLRGQPHPLDALRISLHCYNSSNEIKEVVQLLRHIASQNT